MTHKRIVYVLPDGVSIGYPSDWALALMTGNGGFIREENINREIAKHCIRSKADEAAFKTSWENFYVSISNNPNVPALRSFMDGICFGGLTEDEAIARIQAKDQEAETIAHHFCTATDLPDRTFRDAWECPAGIVKVNMPKARVIHMGRIRKVRDAELKKLDIAYMKALETGDTLEQGRIAALKQQLRDIPQTFDLAGFRAPSTLKAAWPSELPPQEQP